MASVQIADVDDYINPSQACINPLFTSTKRTTSNPNNTTSNTTNKNGNERYDSGSNKTRRRRRRRTPLVISEPQSVSANKNTSTSSASIKRPISSVDVESTSLTIGGSAGIVRYSDHADVDVDANSDEVIVNPLKIVSIDGTKVGNANVSSSRTTNSITTSHRSAKTNTNNDKASIKLSYDDNNNNTNVMEASIPTVPSTGNNDNDNESGNNNRASVSVADCLACSGCITSSEAVLVTTQHSIQTLLKKCCHADDQSDHMSRRIVFTISPAAIADLTRVLGVSNGKDKKNGYGCQQEKAQEIEIMYQKLASYLHDKLNASIILDGRIPQQFSLLQSALEFCKRYRYLHTTPIRNSGKETELIDNNDDNCAKSGVNTTMGKDSCRNYDWSNDNKTMNNGLNGILDSRIQNDLTVPSIALSATETRYLVRSKEQQRQNQQHEGIEVKHEAGIDPRLHYLLRPNTEANHKISLSKPSSNVIHPQRILPMLASSCPGFICYVEKTMSDVIPNLCTVKSPMAIAGSMFKHDLLSNEGHSTNKNDNNRNVQSTERTGKSNGDIYHVAIMPCHDKKLEAERKDLAWDRYVKQQEKIIPDVDLVITTHEFFSMFVESALENEGRNKEGTLKQQQPNEYSENTGTGLGKEKEVLKIAKKYFDALPLAPMKNWTEIGDDYDCSYVSSVGINSNGVDSAQTKGESTNKSSDIDWTMSGSGSYAEFIFRFASNTLFGHHIPLIEELPWKNVTRRGFSGSNHSHATRKRNGQNFSDHSEVGLYQHRDGTFSCNPRGADGQHNGKAVLKFATMYGFKNIQLLMQKMKNGETANDQYHYVETMACPSGCLNGGGQIKTENILNSNRVEPTSTKRREKPSEKRERVQRSKLFLQDSIPSLSEENNKIGVMMGHESLLHTRYHVVPKLELATGSTAGVAIDDTHW